MKLKEVTKNDIPQMFLASRMPDISNQSHVKIDAVPSKDNLSDVAKIEYILSKFNDLFSKISFDKNINLASINSTEHQIKFLENFINIFSILKNHFDVSVDFDSKQHINLQKNEIKFVFNKKVENHYFAHRASMRMAMKKSTNSDSISLNDKDVLSKYMTMHVDHLKKITNKFKSMYQNDKENVNKILNVL